jgi:hypothetical protein
MGPHCCRRPNVAVLFAAASPGKGAIAGGAQTSDSDIDVAQNFVYYVFVVKYRSRLTVGQTRNPQKQA